MSIRHLKHVFIDLIKKPLVYTRRLQLPMTCCELVPHEGFLDPEIELLIGTASGLYGVFSGQLFRLIKGRVYGISECQGRWYIVINQRLSFYGKLHVTVGYIISFELIGNQCKNLKVEFSPLSGGIHQIQWHLDHLLVADTPNNRLLVLSRNNDALSIRKEVFPKGRVVARTDTNYCHINSIHPSAGSIFLVYHNDSTKTGRNSEIAQLDENFEVVATYETEAKCAHNFFDHSSGYVYCDSLNGRLIAGNESVFGDRAFLRGLEFVKRTRHWVVGESDFKSKMRKVSNDSSVYYLDEKFHCVGDARLAGIGSIYEVREVPQSGPG